MKTETGSPTPNHVRVSKLPIPLTPTMLSTRSFRSGALRFPGLNLCLKRLVLFRQRIAGSCHCFDIVSQLAVLSLKFHHLCLQSLVLLQSFCVLASSQGQTQHYRHSKSHPSVFARQASSLPPDEFELQLEHPIAGEEGRLRWQLHQRNGVS
jgi:hypothetical protein